MTFLYTLLAASGSCSTAHRSRYSRHSAWAARIIGGGSVTGTLTLNAPTGGPSAVVVFYPNDPPGNNLWYGFGNPNENAPNMQWIWWKLRDQFTDPMGDTEPVNEVWSSLTPSLPAADYAETHGVFTIGAGLQWTTVANGLLSVPDFFSYGDIGNDGHGMIC